MPMCMPASSRSRPTSRASWPTSRCRRTRRSRTGQVLFTPRPRAVPHRSRRRRGAARRGPQRDRDAAGDLPAEAGADRAGEDRRRLLRDRLPAPAGSAEARRRLAGGLRSGQARPRRRARARGLAQREADATLAQLGGNAERRSSSNARYLAAQAQVDKAKRDLPHHRPGADGRHRHQCRCAAGRPVSAGGPAGLQPGRLDRRLDRGQSEGDRSHLSASRASRRSSRSTPIPAANGRRRSPASAPATGAEFSVLPAQNASGNWVKVVQRVPVRLAERCPPMHRRCAPA